MSNLKKKITNYISIIFQVNDFPPAHNKLKTIEQPLAYADPTVLRAVYQGETRREKKE
jgi:hypothetical protein